MLLTGAGDSGLRLLFQKVDARQGASGCGSSLSRSLSHSRSRSRSLSRSLSRSGSLQ